MTSYQRKCLALGTYSPVSPNQSVAVREAEIAQTQSTYARITVRWDYLAPTAPPAGVAVNPSTDYNTPIPGGGASVAEYVAGIENEIRRARAIGLNVTLLFHLFPSWVNGGRDNLTPPDDISDNSYYSQYLIWMAARWSVQNPDANGAYTDFLEICNEPERYRNLSVSPATVAGRMMRVAALVQFRLSVFGRSTPIYSGPAHGGFGDAVGFTNELCSYLRATGFSGFGAAGNPRFAWTHHNYRDVQSASRAPSGAQAVRSVLRQQGWRGWPYADDTNPYLLLTEGGYRIGTGGVATNNTPTDQAIAVASAYNQVHNDAAGQGQGLAMFTQYLEVTDPNYDTGLRECYTPYAQRPLWQAWRDLIAP